METTGTSKRESHRSCVSFWEDIRVSFDKMEKEGNLTGNVQDLSFFEHSAGKSGIFGSAG